MSKNMVFIEQWAVWSSGVRAKYWEHVRRTCKTVEVKHIADVLSQEAIDQIIDSAMPRLKECFRNAYNISEIGGYEYVEGLVNVCGLPIEHAWNKTKDGRYFDATFDLLGLEPGEEYTSLYEGTLDDISRLSLQSHVYGGYPNQVFLNSLETNGSNTTA